MDILVVVDMQNDFVKGALGSKEAEEIVLNVVEKVKNFKGLIYFTQDTHHEDYLQSKEGSILPVKHCIKNTWGWEIIDELKPYVKSIIEKPTFGSLNLIEELSKVENISSITLIGLCTDICVISNAMLLKAKFYEIPIIVDSKCCAGVSVSSHNNALNAMKVCHIEIQ